MVAAAWRAVKVLAGLRAILGGSVCAEGDVAPVPDGGNMPTAKRFFGTRRYAAEPILPEVVVRSRQIP